jgi:hypothetical protein
VLDGVAVGVDGAVLLFGGEENVAGSSQYLNSLFVLSVPVTIVSESLLTRTTNGTTPLRINVTGLNEFGAVRVLLQGTYVRGGAPSECTNVSLVASGLASVGRTWDLVCNWPEGAGSLVNAVVVVRRFVELQSPPAQVVRYLAPVVASLAFTAASTGGGDELQLLGANFGGNYSDLLAITVGDANCELRRWLGHDQVICALPPGQGSNISVAIRVGDQLSNVTSGSVLSYDAPSVTAVRVWPSNVSADSVLFSTDGGAALLVQGTNFGVGRSDGVFPFTSLPVVTLIGAARNLSCVNVTLLGAAALTCAVPAGGGANLSLAVNVGGLASPASSTRLSYALPAIATLVFGPAPVQGGSLLTIQGSNFGGPLSQRVAFVGARSCNSTTALDRDSLLCVVPPLDGAQPSQNVTVRVTVDGQTSTPSTALFSYSQPVVISALASGPAPTFGGAVIVVRGLELGTSEFPPRVTVGGAACRSQLWVSETEVRCEVGEGAGANLSIALDVGGQVLVAPQAFSYDAPSITSWEIDSSPGAPLLSTEGGAVLKINGSNLGAPQGADPLAIYVSERWTCVNVSRASHTSAQCVLPPAFGRNLSVYAVLRGQRSAAAPGALSFPLPAVEQLANETALSPIPTRGGVTLQLQASNLPPTDANDTAILVRLVLSSGAAFDCSNVTRSGLRSLECVVGPGFGRNLSLSIGTRTAGDTLWGPPSSSVAARVDYAMPEVTATSGDRGADTDGRVGGVQAVLTVAGANFGPGTAAALPAVTVGGAICLTTTWASHEELRCVVAPGVGRNLPISVRVGAENADRVSTTSTSVFSFNAPTVVSVASVVAPTAGGSVVVIGGRNFGRAGDGAAVFIGSRACSGVSVTSAHTQLTCTLPDGFGAGLSVTVSVGMQNGTNSSVTFAYSAPVITHFSQSAGAPTIGWTPENNATLDVSGENFGPADAAAVVLISGVPCKRTLWRSHSQLACQLPESSGVGLPLVVSVGGLASVPALLRFSYDAPVVEALVVGAASTRGGYPLLLRGRNFGPVSATNVSVLLATLACANVTVLSHESATCTVPVGAGRDLPVAISVSGQSSASSAAAVFSFAPPSIASLVSAQSSFSTRGNESLTLLGANFGPAFAPFSVSIGGRPCLLATRESHESIVCATPSGTGRRLEVRVVVAGQSSPSDELNAARFDYAPPVVTAVSVVPGSVLADGSLLLVVRGRNFGPVNGSDLTVRVGARLCEEVVRVVAEEELRCRVPPGSGSGLTVSVRVGGQVSQAQVDDEGRPEASTLFSYPAPVIESVEPSIVVLQLAERLTVRGAYFGANASAVQVWLGSAACQGVRVVESNVALECTTPKFDKQDTVDVVVVVGDQRSAPWPLRLRVARISDLLWLVILALATLLEIAFVALLLFILRNRANPEIKASSVLFSSISILGAMMEVGAVYTLRPAEYASFCNVAWFLVAVGFTFLFTSLFLKNYRILSVFNNRKLTVNVITDQRLLIYLACFIALDVLLLLPFSVANDCTRTLSVTAFGFAVVLVCYKLALLVAGVILAWKSRVVHIERFNERQQLGYAIYNIAFFIVVILPITVLLSDDAESLFLVRSVGLMYVSAVTAAVLFVPKIIAMRAQKAGGTAHGEAASVSISRQTSHERQESRVPFNRVQSGEAAGGAERAGHMPFSSSMSGFVLLGESVTHVGDSAGRLGERTVVVEEETAAEPLEPIGARQTSWQPGEAPAGPAVVAPAAAAAPAAEGSRSARGASGGSVPPPALPPPRRSSVSGGRRGSLSKSSNSQQQADAAPVPAPAPAPAPATAPAAAPPAASERRSSAAAAPVPAAARPLASREEEEELTGNALFGVQLPEFAVDITRRESLDRLNISDGDEEPHAPSAGGAAAAPPPLPLAPPWQQFLSDDGVPFYFNPDTGTRQWERPR